MSGTARPIGKATRIFELGDIARVPFPYADRATVHHRPAVVIATRLGLDGALVWVAMITAAENRRWPGDIEIADHLAAGLPIPSIVRTSKIATLAAGRAERRGALASDVMALVQAEIRKNLQVGTPGFNE